MCRIGWERNGAVSYYGAVSGGFASFKDGQCAPATLPAVCVCATMAAMQLDRVECGGAMERFP